MASRKLAKRIEAKRLLDIAFNQRENVVKISKANTLEHELAKFYLCYEALRLGYKFVTEAIFKNGKRADIFILDLCEAWEVLHSETKEQFKEKKESYPCKVIPFESKRVIELNRR